VGSYLAGGCSRRSISTHEGKVVIVLDVMEVVVGVRRVVEDEVGHIIAATMVRSFHPNPGAGVLGFWFSSVSVFLDSRCSLKAF